MGLKLIFLIVSRAVSVLSLSRRQSWRKVAEILMLRLCMPKISSAQVGGVVVGGRGYALV